MKKRVALGNPMCVTFICRHLVNSVLTAFDPPLVMCSWIKPNGNEDAQTYGGVAPRDNLLTRTSVGHYQSVYVSDVAGDWSVSPYWRDTVGGITYSFRPVTPGYFIVEPVPFTFIDAPSGPTGTHRVYWGAGVASIRDTATLELMSHSDQTTYNFTTTAFTVSNQKAYVMVPASWAAPLITLDGLEVDVLAAATVSLHDTDGSLISYQLYETTNLLTDAALQLVVSF